MALLDFLNKRVSRRDMLKKSVVASAVVATGAIGAGTGAPLTEKVEAVTELAPPMPTYHPIHRAVMGTGVMIGGTSGINWMGGTYPSNAPSRKRRGNCKQCGGPLNYDEQCPYCGTWVVD